MPKGPVASAPGTVRAVVSEAGAAVKRATLYLYSHDEAQRKGSTGSYGAYPLTRDWSEGSVSWSEAASGNAWSTPGGDFLSSPDGTSPKLGHASAWYPFDVTSRVQIWLDNAGENHGWIIKCTDEGLDNQDYFYQADTVKAEFRPKLVITDVADPVAGDITGDGQVGIFDLLVLAESWATVTGEGSFDVRADLNSDGAIDIFDLLILADNWNG